jgi:hypothetical protein
MEGEDKEELRKTIGHYIFDTERKGKEWRL